LKAQIAAFFEELTKPPELVHEDLNTHPYERWISTVSYHYDTIRIPYLNP